ncbi:MAG: OB-fold domain-containing protein [Ignavibacteriales bacterium]|nr:OB-fold domain-containing protein [Ignavibacteriales bacterium]
MEQSGVITAALFEKSIAEKKLLASKSRSTGELFIPARPVTPETVLTDMDLVPLSGRGTLAGFSVVAIAPSSMLKAGYDRKNQYCVGIVKLEEGPSISAQILGVDIAHPESIKIGTSLVVEFIERGEGESKGVALAFRYNA